MQILANTTEGTDQVVTAPLKDGNTPYRFEMYFDGGARRAYADTAEELLTVLIDGYATLDDQARMTARLHLAVRTQTTAQAAINAAFDLNDPQVASPEEYAVLQASRATPPQVQDWTSPVPLVLVDVYYAPIGDLPAPLGNLDVTEPDNLYWLRPSDPEEFLVSLARVGLINLHEHADFDA